MNSKNIFFIVLTSFILVPNLDAMLPKVTTKPLTIGYLNHARGLTKRNHARDIIKRNINQPKIEINKPDTDAEQEKILNTYLTKSELESLKRKKPEFRLWHLLGALATWIVVLFGPRYLADRAEQKAKQEKEKYEVIYVEGLWGDFVPVRVLKEEFQPKKQKCVYYDGGISPFHVDL